MSPITSSLASPPYTPLFQTQDKGAFLLKAPSFLLDEINHSAEAAGYLFIGRRGEWRRQVERCRDYSPPFH